LLTSATRCTLSALLHARRERTHGRTAKKRDELAAFQLIEWHSIPASQARAEL
jgi:hypothetical protein